MKYIFLNDVQYICHKRKRFVLLLLFIPLIVLLINYYSSLSVISKIVFSTGTGVSFNKSNVFEIIIYILNISISLFLVTDVYIKDIDYKLDTIFLRLKPLKWFVLKTIVFLTFMIILKLAQYCILYIVLKSFAFDIICLFKICFADLIYVCALQMLFLLLYVVVKCFTKNVIFSIFLFLIMFIFIPKNIYALGSKIIWLVVLYFISFLSVCFLFKFKNKKIFENI
jgi:hypothetical protein